MFLSGLTCYQAKAGHQEQAGKPSGTSTVQSEPVQPVQPLQTQNSCPLMSAPLLGVNQNGINNLVKVSKKKFSLHPGQALSTKPSLLQKRTYEELPHRLENEFPGEPYKKEKLDPHSKYDPSAEAPCTEETCREEYCHRFFTDKELDLNLLEIELKRLSQSPMADDTHAELAEHIPKMGRIHHDNILVLCDRNGTLRGVGSWKLDLEDDPNEDEADEHNSDHDNSDDDDESSGHMFISGLFGHPELHGGGSQILKNLQKRAKELLLKTIYLESLKSAISFYLNREFQVSPTNNKIRTLRPNKVKQRMMETKGAQIQAKQGLKASTENIWMVYRVKP